MADSPRALIDPLAREMHRSAAKLRIATGEPDRVRWHRSVRAAPARHRHWVSQASGDGGISMASGKADREHSGHYLTAVTVVSVAVAGLAWIGQNRTLAAAAAALGVYALHLLSIRFLLDNQRRQRRVLDAQWEVLQRFLDEPDVNDTPADELVFVMPVDHEELDGAGAEELESADPVVPPAEALSLELEDASWLEVSEPAVARGDGSPAGSERTGTEVPVPRHFALGTVALVRNLLTPAEVARVLLEHRRQMGKKFGALAVELGLLTESEREELLLAQQEGLFTDAEMRDARMRLREFRENAAHTLAGLE
jgi:hypothetical protein